MPPLTAEQARNLTSVEELDWDLWTPVETATLLFVIKEDRLLLIRKKRGLGAGKINAPGGKLEPDETPLAAAIRETEEELCITPLSPIYAGEHRFQFRDGYSLHVYLYRAEDFIGTPTETPEAIPIWVHKDEIPYDEMWADDIYWLPPFIRGSSVFGTFIFDNDVMIEHHLKVVD